jgi:hypothetical protein
MRMRPIFAVLYAIVLPLYTALVRVIYIELQKS